mmetsp:Transcript_126126/g.362801  ORF Transcript_126126/g.362801 Transcript_126126/m.362801 type:complete len:215 (-) Transcript_126126:393-1037(-)
MVGLVRRIGVLLRKLRVRLHHPPNRLLWAELLIPKAGAMTVAAIPIPGHDILQGPQADVPLVLEAPCTIVLACRRIRATPLQWQGVPDPIGRGRVELREWPVIPEVVAPRHETVLIVLGRAIQRAGALILREAASIAEALVEGKPSPEVHALGDQLRRRVDEDLQPVDHGDVELPRASRTVRVPCYHLVHEVPDDPFHIASVDITEGEPIHFVF